MGVCLNVYLCAMCMPGIFGGQKKALVPQALELYMILRHRVSSESQT